MKNEYIEVDDKSYQKCKVVMLPTEDFSLVGKYVDNDNLVFNAQGDIPRGQFQHLYFLSDEEIKQGDWVLINSKYIRQVNKIENEKYFTVCGNNAIFIISAQKIIASTDKSLRLGKDTYYQGKEVGFYTEQSKIFPRPSNEFLNAYCKQGEIDEVLVEFMECQTYRDDACDVRFSCCNNRFKLKVAADNTITTKPVKNSWSRKELEVFKSVNNQNFLQFIYDRLKHVYKENENYDYMLKLEKIVNWVEKNL